VVSDLGARFTSQGTLAGNVGDITNVQLSVGDAAVTPTTAVAVDTDYQLLDSNGNECLIVTINNDLADGNVTVAAGDKLQILFVLVLKLHAADLVKDTLIWWSWCCTLI
jgi:hypothetical protein